MCSFRYKKGSTKISTLCTTKVRYPSVIHSYIGTLSSNKLLQLEAKCDAIGWKNPAKLAEFFRLGKNMLTCMTFKIVMKKNLAYLEVCERPITTPHMCIKWWVSTNNMGWNSYCILEYNGLPESVVYSKKHNIKCYLLQIFNYAIFS